MRSVRGPDRGRYSWAQRCPQAEGAAERQRREGFTVTWRPLRSPPGQVRPAVFVARPLCSAEARTGRGGDPEWCQVSPPSESGVSGRCVRCRRGDQSARRPATKTDLLSSRAAAPRKKRRRRTCGFYCGTSIRRVITGGRAAAIIRVYELRPELSAPRQSERASRRRSGRSSAAALLRPQRAALVADDIHEVPFGM